MHLRVPISQTRIIPYGVLGFGLIHSPSRTENITTPDPFNPAGTVQTPYPVSASTNFATSFGGGLRYYTTERLGFRGEFKAYKPTGTYTTRSTGSPAESSSNSKTECCPRAPRGARGVATMRGLFYRHWIGHRLLSCFVRPQRAESHNHRCGNRVGLSGRWQGGGESAPLGLLDAVGVDGSGNVLVADPQNHVVIRIGADGIAHVIAGNTIPGFSGDGGPAVNASLNQPESVTADRAGNIYIADGGNDRIRRELPYGIITTIAGNGITGYAGDGGPAVAAALNFPTDVQVDSSGNLYLIDTGNIRIRRVSTNGVISTVAELAAKAVAAVQLMPHRPP